jgi:hypothetical protein
MVTDQMRERAGDRRQKDIGGQEASPGYSVNGEGEWSRHAAGGGSVDTQTDTRTKERQEWSDLDHLVAHEIAVMGRLKRRMAEATDPDKIRLIRKRLDKTQVLLDRLRAEQRSLAS